MNIKYLLIRKFPVTISALILLIKNKNLIMENYGYTKDSNTQQNYPYKSEKKIPAALLGILVGWLALNKFYLGYTKEGIIQLVLNVVTCGIASVIPFIEGILYLFMSDEQFDNTYVHNKKGWL
jgi:TM2 domain-containing membrane protein YozV